MGGGAELRSRSKIASTIGCSPSIMPPWQLWPPMPLYGRSMRPWRRCSTRRHNGDGPLVRPGRWGVEESPSLLLRPDSHAPRSTAASPNSTLSPDAIEDADCTRTRIRRPGGGRHRLTTNDRSLLQDLQDLVDPATRGDPMSPLRWTLKSTRHLATELGRARPSHQSSEVAALLKGPTTACRATARPTRARPIRPRRPVPSPQPPVRTSQ